MSRMAALESINFLPVFYSSFRREFFFSQEKYIQRVKLEIEQKNFFVIIINLKLVWTRLDHSFFFRKKRKLYTTIHRRPLCIFLKTSQQEKFVFVL